MPQDGEKFSGKPFPTPANPGSLVCFMIHIPDDIKYRAALLGQIGWLADWRAWRHSDVDYVTEIPEVNIEIAGLFARALLESTFGECMDCEGVALCIVENEIVQAAIAGAINNSTLIQSAIIQQITNYGSGVPGQPLTNQQAQIDILPVNIKPGTECDLNAAWGASLYLVQSASRAITDLFEQLEVLTNPAERAEIASGAIPAVGNYISAAAGFIDQVAEELAEGYTGAYTETVEQEIACAIFCLIQQNCTLNIDEIIDIFAVELGELDVSDFLVVMNFVATGGLLGTQIVYAAFLIYFTALKFGQQFGDKIGLRPLTDLMGLGADYLASDNWETLCTCNDLGDWKTVFLPGYFTGELTYDADTGEYTLTAQSNTDTVYRAVAIGRVTGSWTFTCASIPAVDYPAYYPPNSTGAIGGAMVSGNSYNGISYASQTPFSLTFTLTPD